jgi:putative mRNA 3-end processing factor
MTTREPERTPAGLWLPELELHLDPHADVRRAFVSHAHGDHAGGAGSGEVFASPETLALLAARAGAEGGVAERGRARPIAWDGAIELPVSPAFGGGTARLSIAPAGHMCGAAALVVDGPAGRLVYTGDTSAEAGETYGAPAVVPCDELVIEATFALPIFRFPPRAATWAKLEAFCRGAIDAGETPLLLAHALGKAQEITARLVRAGLPVTLHGAAYKMARAYEALGIPLGIADGQTRAYTEAEGAKRGKGKERPATRVVVAPPRARAQVEKTLKNARVALVSGWALLDAQLEQNRADAGFVLSDHADHAALVARAAGSGARAVTAVYGDAEPFARILQGRGLVARAVDLEAIDAREAETA